MVRHTTTRSPNTYYAIIIEYKVREAKVLSPYGSRWEDRLCPKKWNIPPITLQSFNSLSFIQISILII